MGDSIHIGMHIPKTAGTSLRVGLVEAFGEEEIGFVYRLHPGVPVSRFVEDYNRRYAQSSVIYGHFAYGLHEKLGVTARYFTILRDPLARAVSLYRHEFRNSGALYHAEARAMGIGEFCRNPPSMQFNNSMVRMLAGQLQQEGKWFLQFDASMTELYALAKKHIRESFAYVGLTETLGHDRNRLEDILGRPIRIGRHNTDPDPPVLDTLARGDLLAIQEAFEYDQKLYDYVRQQT